ncbi:FAD-dependent monooxygenase [Stigmatella sp. ncwal1]|uniref:FAD-dependent monooxygenase n=1 Tax=Stigmatella ashevillensis TaxID=2995309 RepID=A0ABT5D215_9BACT|nr:FAD-dependent monooxygenase [Stigmatella ashevillena]MDC0707135.1 FAD-dependent monooxygenase [Stigmatella ashevillena]
MDKIYDVVIGGAGPVGLFLACELGMRGVSVLVLERDETAASPWKTAPLGTRGLNVPSVEAFYRRGMLDEVLDPGERPSTLKRTAGFEYAGHFACMMLDANKLDLSRWKYVLPGPALLPSPSETHRIETALSHRAEGFDVTVLRGKPVTAFAQSSEGVTVESGGERFRGKWLVGCDGGRSTIRKAADFEFVGTEAEFTGYSVLCDLDDLSKLKPGWNLTPKGAYIVAQEKQLIVVDFDGSAFHRTQPITREHFETVLRRVSGTDVSVTALHLASTFTDRVKQASTYRKGRVLLAGDSAHIHSPLGAQGLSTGIGDAMNLGWKLAATIKGTAPNGLIDTYTQERHPIGAWVLEWTRAQVTVMRPDPYGHAMAKVIRGLIETNDGTHYFVERFWGNSQRYDLGDVHPLVGASAPDFELGDGTRLGTKLEPGRALLIDFSKNGAIAQRVRRWASSVDYLNVHAKNELGLKALLVRPDGIVAWVGEDAVDLESLRAALSRWFSAAES